MPRLIHEFAKVETRVLNDPRFFRLSEYEQLIYLKLLILAKVLNNKIYKQNDVLSDVMRDRRPLNDLKMTVKRLHKIFPKFKACKQFYFFDDFPERYSKQEQSRVEYSRVEGKGSNDPKNRPSYSPKGMPKWVKEGAAKKEKNE